MSRWEDVVTSTADEARGFWSGASVDTLERMMGPRQAWLDWLVVAAGVIDRPGLVFEPGCGVGLLAGLLPEGCSYYGCDVNPEYVAEAVERYGERPGVTFEVRPLESVLEAGERFDWVVVTSLFGMFPEEAAYDLLPRFWDAARLGVSLTTMERRLMPRHRLMRFEFSAHDPDRLVETTRSLPGLDRLELHRGREYPEVRGTFWTRGLVLYAWKDRRLLA